MIEIKIFKEANHIKGIESKGHAGYAEDGQDDIVCSAVSSITQTAMLGLMQIVGIKLDYDIDGANGYLKFSLPQNISDEQIHDADIILGTMLCGIEDIHEGFSNFVKLEVL